MIFLLHKNRKRAAVFSVLVLLFHSFTGYPIEPIYAQDGMPQGLYANAYALMDADTKRVLCQKNGAEAMANASTTKILTCIVTLENSSLDREILVSKKAAAQPQVRMGLLEGCSYSLESLLYGLMLESYNDCAVAIAEGVAGSVEEFAGLMNQKAKELGCDDSYFITPNGLDAEDGQGFHHTTAEDLCRIMAYCTWDSPKSKEFLKITQTLDYQYTDASGTKHAFVNHNQLLRTMPEILSGKTGFTAKAGYCYVAAYEKKGIRLCVALLACGWPNHKNYKWEDTKKLLDYAESSLKRIKIEDYALMESGHCFDGHKERYSIRDWKQMVSVVPEIEHTQKQKLEKLCFLVNAEEKIEKQITYDKTLQLPLEKGTKIGTVSYYIGDTVIAKAQICAAESVYEWKLPELWVLILQNYFV